MFYETIAAWSWLSAILMQGFMLHYLLASINTGPYLREVVPMASTKIAFYIYYLLMSPGINVYVYY